MLCGSAKSDVALLPSNLEVTKQCTNKDHYQSVAAIGELPRKAVKLFFCGTNR